MCSKHVEARNKLIVKQKFCESSWIITEINVTGVKVIFNANFKTLSGLIKSAFAGL